MSSKRGKKASSTSSSTADDTKRATKLSDIVVPSAKRYATDDDGDFRYADDDDGDYLYYADLAALSIQPTLSSSSTKTATSSSSTASPLSWQIWRYDCRDLPAHGCKYPPHCGYCREVNKLNSWCPNAEDHKRWRNFLKPGRIFDNAKGVLKYLNLDTDNVLPSKLARQVFFDRKLGTAFFRAGIEPIAKSPDNRDGGSFQLLLLATNYATGRHPVKSFDKLFVYTMQLIAELPESIQKCINGVFYRCEINPGKRLPKMSLDTYRDHENLPFMGKLEVWIGDVEQTKLVYWELITKIDAHIKNLFIPSEACRKFLFKERD